MLAHYLSSQFLFGTGIALYSRGDKYLLVLNVLIFLVGGVCIVLASKKNLKNNPISVLLAKWASLLLTMGVFALLWSVMREQGIVMLSSHILIAAIYVIAIIWAVPILKYQCTKYKEFANEHQKMVERERYLPK